MKKTLKEKNNPNKKPEIIEKVVRESVLKVKAVRTGLAGFIICLKNLYSLCETIFKLEICKFVLSYKLSQDHVEMFFALIRRMNGNCRNPTAIHFLSAYKKLLLNNMNVSVPPSANCSPQDSTLLISNETDHVFTASTVENKENIIKPEKKEKKKKKFKPSKELTNMTQYLSLNHCLMDHDYSERDGWVESSYSDEIFMHTAGAVVHQILPEIHCEECKKMLLVKPTKESGLTKKPWWFKMCS